MIVLRYLLLLTIAVFCASCGGGGVGGPPIPAGHYIGTWNAPDASDNGTADITIGADGSVSGTVTSVTYGPNGTANGYVFSTGNAGLTPVFPVGPGIGWTDEGRLHLTTPTRVTGTLRRQVGD